MRPRRALVLAAAVLGLAALLPAPAGCSKRDAAPAAQGTADGKVGEPLMLDDSTWLVVEAKDLGQTLKPNSDIGEPLKTEGRFVQVRYRVTNTTKKQEHVLDLPKIVDQQGREFGPVDMESWYVPVQGKTVGFDALQPSMQKEYFTIIEVPADARKLAFQVRGLGLRGDRRRIDLGL